MPPEGPRDPFSKLAESAAELHEMFRACTEAGFTSEQALRIVIAIVTARIRPAQ
jgi:hypothetical protein